MDKVVTPDVLRQEIKMSMVNISRPSRTRHGLSVLPYVLLTVHITIPRGGKSQLGNKSTVVKWLKIAATRNQVLLLDHVATK